MTYSETIEYLYNSAPLFQHIGSKAYKAGLETTLLLDDHWGHPHHNFKSIHIGGTNGKGSCAHTLAAILQMSGLKVGLYASPHLKDFRERIRINGEMIPQERVIDFIEKEKDFFEPLHPSFFELTTALAFKYFSDEKVDIAVIEVGLGGRLDCTNIITPILSIITNISLDHTQLLGNSLSEIAQEKAGIIKPNVPIVIGETHPETRPIFQIKADAEKAPITFAEDTQEIKSARFLENGKLHYETLHWGNFSAELSGKYQIKNTNTILNAVRVLQQYLSYTTLTLEHVHKAFYNVNRLTGLQGRWQIIGQSPMVICDTGHNAGGWKYLSQQLATSQYNNLHIVFGMAADKDINSVLNLLPKNAFYYFTQASVRRAMPATELKELATRHNLEGETYPDVTSAFIEAQKRTHENDIIYIGGSSFIVADLLSFLEESHLNGL